MKKYHVISGLPRSGSTLLANILNQNPKFHASGTSSLPKLLVDIRNAWESYPENRANQDWVKKENVLKGVVESFYQNVDKDIIFDKSRVWSIESELAKFALGDNMKFIITVRDLPNMLASFENLYRKNAHIYTTIDKKNSNLANTVSGRCDLLVSNAGPIGSSVISLKELLLKGGDNILIIDYDDLVRKPALIIDDLYEFIGEDKFKHDFNNVEQTIFEKDEEHGILDLHTIKPKVEPSKLNPTEILGAELVKKFQGGKFWK